MTLPDVAEAFHGHGYNVFLYDARSVGASGGSPRNLLDPLQMAEDLSGQFCGANTLNETSVELRPIIKTYTPLFPS
jgi:alpha-beta hydrolase superfamily lysophospholipase